MASTFTPKGTVLFFGPLRAREHRHKWTPPEYILWPAWAYRVVAPRVEVRRLDVFERAILGLCKAEQQDVRSISRRLCIESELAAFILDQLSSDGCVDSDGLATDQGRRLLEEEAFDDPEMVVGYVFQDPWNGALWPRFVEQFDYCELEHNEKGFPQLMLGTPGKPWRQNPLMVCPKKETPRLPPPSSKDVISAIAGHRRGVRYADILAEREEDPVLPGASISESHMERVSSIGTPTPVFLVTYLYTVAGAEHTGAWYACDPFGLGASVRLHRRVAQMMQTVPSLHNLVTRLAGEKEPAKQQLWQLRSKNLQTNAEQEVARRLSDHIRTHDAFKQIVDMECAHQEVVSLEKNCPAFKVHAAFDACRQSLEAVFGAIAKEHPFGAIWKCVYVSRSDPETGLRLVPQQDRAWLEATYKAAARAVGFAEPIPEPLLSIRPKDIRLVVEGGDRRLWPLVMACLLLAQMQQPSHPSQPSHPLRDVAARTPGLLRDIDKIARQREDLAPVDGAQGTVSDVSTTVESTYHVMSILLGFGPPPRSNR